MKLRPFLAALLAFWLVFGPAATTWAASAPAPCESMGAPAPADDCCDEDTMDASACLSACVAASPAAAAAALQIHGVHALGSAVAGLSLWYATFLAPPDIAPPKPSVS